MANKLKKLFHTFLVNSKLYITLLDSTAFYHSSFY